MKEPLRKVKAKLCAREMMIRVDVWYRESSRETSRNWHSHAF